MLSERNEYNLDTCNGFDFFFIINKMKSKKYHTAETFPKFNSKIVEWGNINTCNIQIHDRSIFCLGTGISIKNGGANPNVWA